MEKWTESPQPPQQNIQIKKYEMMGGCGEGAGGGGGGINWINSKWRGGGGGAEKRPTLDTETDTKGEEEKRKKDGYFLNRKNGRKRLREAKSISPCKEGKRCQVNDYCSVISTTEPPLCPGNRPFTGIHSRQPSLPHGGKEKAKGRDWRSRDYHAEEVVITTRQTLATVKAAFQLWRVSF